MLKYPWSPVPLLLTLSSKMASSGAIALFALILFVTRPFALNFSAAAIFDILNRCPYTIWPAVYPGAGGRQLDPGEIWTVSIPPGTNGRIRARTGCSFDASGRGACETCDCDGLLSCKTDNGSTPCTLAEFSLNQFQDNDYFDISLVDGFNLPMEFLPWGGSNCSSGPQCTADLTASCPDELKAPGGCNNPCTVYKTEEYCCLSGSEACGPNKYSKFFWSNCPNVYSYALDESMTTFTCPGGTDYKVVFCSNASAWDRPVEFPTAFGQIFVRLVIR